MTRAVLEWVLERLSEGEKVGLASVIEAKGSVPGKPGARMAISSAGSRFGTVGGAGLEKSVEDSLRNMLESEDRNAREKGGRVESYVLHRERLGKEETALDSLCGGKVTITMEILEPAPHILIVGGGHVGRCIAIVCDTLGWSHSVYDVREEFANEERFPFASELHSSKVEEFLTVEGAADLKRFSDVLLLSHDWSVDEDFLIRLLDQRGDARRPRIGAIGSKSKWTSFRRTAIDSGIQVEDVESVRCPIGLDIGADSPEEIALAVCSEILSLEKGVNSSED